MPRARRSPHPHRYTGRFSPRRLGSGALVAAWGFAILAVAAAAEVVENPVPEAARPALAAVHAAHRDGGRTDVMLPTGPAVLDYAAALADQQASLASRLLVSAILDDTGMAGPESQIMGVRLAALAVVVQAYLVANDPVRAHLVLGVLDQAGAPAPLPRGHETRRENAAAELARRAAATGDAGAANAAWNTEAQALFAAAPARQAARQEHFSQFLAAYSANDMGGAATAGEALLAVTDPDDILGAITTLMLARTLTIGRDSDSGDTGQDVTAARPWLERVLALPPSFLAAVPGGNFGAANPVETLILGSNVFRQERFFDAGFATALARRAAEIATAVEGHPQHAAALEALAGSHEAAGDRDRAEAAWQAVIDHYRALDPGQLPPQDRRRFAGALAALAAIASATPGAETRAETGFVDALRIAEAGGTALDDLRSDILTRLGDFYAEQGRTEDALGVTRAALGLGEAAGQGNAPGFAYLLARLGALEVQAGAFSQARLTLARARSLALRTLAATDPVHEMILEGLVAIHEGRGEPVPEAVTAALVAARNTQVGSPAPMVLRARDFGAAINRTYAAFSVGDFDAAVAEAQAALALADTAGEPNWQIDALRVLAILEDRRDNRLAALDHFRRAETLRAGAPTLRLAERQNDILAHLQTALSAAHEAGAEVGRPLFNEAFGLATRLNRARVGAEVQSANLRRTLGDRPVAGLLRQLQDARAQRDDLSADLMVKLSTGAPVTKARAAIDAADARISRLEAELEGGVPEYPAHLGGAETTLDEAIEVLDNKEALVLFATRPVPADGGMNQLGAAFLLTRAGFAALPIYHEGDLAALALRLRCAAALTDPHCAGMRATGDQRGGVSLVSTGSGATPKDGFDYGAAYAAYAALLEPLPLDAIPGGIDSLVIVPDSTLIAMPFNLMVTQPTPEDTPVQEAPWLMRDMAVTVAPSVASFVGLRRNSGSDTPRPERFLGVGDPLIGVQSAGPVDFDCTRITARVPPTAALHLSQRGVLGDSAAVSALAALPDTRCELDAIAARFSEGATLLTQDRATETAIKALSAEGRLRDYAVLSFATHGLVAGEVGANRAALVLTPPDAAGDGDDGLLTSPEIAALDLDADFVMLSACNTAAGEDRDAEGLTGLAAAFFYAGARNLLVSHWPVYSDAATRLTTGLMQELDAAPALGRAQALRRAMLAILDDPTATARERHPSYWAPFMIVGEGGSR